MTGRTCWSCGHDTAAARDRFNHPMCPLCLDLYHVEDRERRPLLDPAEAPVGVAVFVPPTCRSAA